MARMVMAVLAALLLGACGSSCKGSHYKKISSGHNWIGRIKVLTEAFDTGLSEWVTAEGQRCKKEHGPKTPKFAVCVKPALSFSRYWTGKVMGAPTGRGILPAIQSAQKAARHSLNAAFDYVKANEAACGMKKETAERKACEKKVGAWKKLLKPGACALIEMIDRGVKLGAYKVVGHVGYKLAKTLVETILGGCDK